MHWSHCSYKRCRAVPYIALLPRPVSLPRCPKKQQLPVSLRLLSLLHYFSGSFSSFCFSFIALFLYLLTCHMYNSNASAVCGGKNMLPHFFGCLSVPGSMQVCRQNLHHIRTRGIHFINKFLSIFIRRINRICLVPIIYPVSDFHRTGFQTLRILLRIKRNMCCHYHRSAVS